MTAPETNNTITLNECDSQLQASHDWGEKVTQVTLFQ